LEVPPEKTEVVKTPQQTVAESPPVVPKKSKPATQAFFDAALNGNIAFVESELLEGVDPKAKSPTNQTAVMLAAFNGHTGVVELLLSHGGEIDVQDDAGRTALLYAASGPNEATVKLLLEKGANANVADKVEHWTALMFAAAEGQTAVVQALLEHNADWTLTDIDGENAVDFAKNKGHMQTARVIEAFIQSKTK
jgi:ankyrin repeat protein